MTPAALSRATGYHISVVPWRPSPKHRTRYRAYATEETYSTLTGPDGGVTIIAGAEGLTSSAAISALERAILDAHRLRVLKRDNWQCVVCGSRHALQVHHVIHRSQGRDHRLSNLVTLCATRNGTIGGCHAAEHAGHPATIEAIRDYMKGLNP